MEKQKGLPKLVYVEHYVVINNLKYTDKNNYQYSIIILVTINSEAPNCSAGAVFSVVVNHLNYID